jgi:hypothetical protein
MFSDSSFASLELVRAPTAPHHGLGRGLHSYTASRRLQTTPVRAGTTVTSSPEGDSDSMLNQLDGESAMRQVHKIVIAVGVVLVFLASGYGQSLGDVAREQRHKQTRNGNARKVVTNEDFPEQSEPTSSTSVSSDENETSPAAPASNDGPAAKLWKAKIETQKNSVASLQSQIDRLNDSIHFVGGNCRTNCLQYNQEQIRKQDKVQRMQTQLEEQKHQLEDMQESARKAGLGNSVYEP